MILLRTVQAGAVYLPTPYGSGGPFFESPIVPPLLAPDH